VNVVQVLGGADRIGRAGHRIQRFRTFTVDLLDIAEWLQICGIETVTMEINFYSTIREILVQTGSFVEV
jgi:hypothetical protein